MELEDEVMAFGYIKAEWIEKVENSSDGSIIYEQNNIINNPDEVPSSISNDQVSNISNFLSVPTKLSEMRLDMNNTSTEIKPIQLPPVESEVARKIFLYNEILGIFKLDPTLNSLKFHFTGESISRNDLPQLEQEIDKLNLEFRDLVLKNDPSLTKSTNSRDTLLNSRFIALDKIYGEGGMGRVQLGWDTTLMRPVIIKTVVNYNSESAAHLAIKAEAQVSAKIQSPNVAMAYDVFSREGETIFVMDYVSGPSLKDYLSKLESRNNQITTPDTFQLLDTVANAVDEIHATILDGKPIIHRDLKPSNIILNPELGPVIIDFGLTPSAENARNPEGDSVALTPDYASANQYQSGEATIVDDNHALMVIAYELLTGERPFASNSSTIIMINITENHWNKDLLKEKFSSLPNYQELEEFFDRGFKEEPEFYQTYPTASNLITHLEDLVSNIAISPSNSGESESSSTVIQTFFNTISSSINDTMRTLRLNLSN